MNAQQRRLALWAVLGGSVLLALFIVFRPQALPVDTQEASLNKLVVTVDEEGETRVRDIFVLSAPVAGRMLRIEAEAGDEVFANETVIAEIEPVDPTFLDSRSEAQAQAAVRAAARAARIARSRRWERACCKSPLRPARGRGPARPRPLQQCEAARDPCVDADAPRRAAPATCPSQSPSKKRAQCRSELGRGLTWGSELPL